MDTPVHGPQRRIGTGDPRAVAQLQAVRRLAEFPVRTPERDFPCTSAPMSNAHLRIGNGLHQTALESGLRPRGSKHTLDHSFMTGRYEADPHLDGAAETAVEAVLGRTVIHAPEDVLEALDSAPGGCDGHGRMAGSSSREGFGSRLRATTEAFRGIYGPQDRPESTISGLRGVWVGGKSVRGRERRRHPKRGRRPVAPSRSRGWRPRGRGDCPRRPGRGCSGRCPRGVSEASAGAAFRLLWSVSQATLGNTQGLARGAPPPFDPPGKTPAPAAFAVRGFARFRLAERSPAVRRRMFSRRPPIAAGRGRRFPGWSPRRDRRAAWSALPPRRRRSPRPPGRTPPVPPPGLSPLPPTQLSREPVAALGRGQPSAICLR